MARPSSMRSTIISAISASSSPPGSLARKEHDEFASNIDLIDVLPPGLYQATFTPKAEAEAGADLVGGDWVMRCEARTLDDIRALGGNDLADERRFDAAARLSEVNLALYRTFAQPWVRAMATPPLAETMRRLHPLRLSYECSGRGTPFLAWGRALAQTVREHRAPAAPDNPFLTLQARVSDRIVEGLEGYRKAVEATSGGDLPPGLRRPGAAIGARGRHDLRPAAAQGGQGPAAHARRWWRPASPSCAERWRRAACARRRSGRCSMSGWQAGARTSGASRRSAGCAGRRPRPGP